MVDIYADNTVSTRIPPQLIRSDTHGKGAAEIGWGSPGDFKRCENFMRAHGVEERKIEGACANLHKLATGEWPGKNAHKSHLAIAAVVSLTAAVGPTFKGRRWSGPLAPIGVKTGDGRIFPENILKYQSFPMPFGFQEHSGRGHDGAVTVGVIEHAEERMHKGQRIIWGHGYLLNPDIIPDVKKAEHLIEHGIAGASVDLDSYTAALRPDMDGKPLQTLMDGRMRSATLVRIPAFADLRIEFDDDEGDKGTVTASLETETFTVNTNGWKGAPVAPREAQFDADDAVSRIEAWAENDPGKMSKLFLWTADSENSPLIGREGFRLPWGDIIDGKPYLIYHAVYAAAALLSGAHGGLPNISDQEKARLRGVVTEIYSHLAQELGDPNIRAPWDRRPEDERVIQASLVSAVGAVLEEFRDMPGGKRQPRVPGVPGARRSKHIDNPKGGEFIDVPGRGPHGQVKVGGKWVYPEKGAKDVEASARRVAKKQAEGKTHVVSKEDRKEDIAKERAEDIKRAAHLRMVAGHKPAEKHEEKKEAPKPEPKKAEPKEETKPERNEHQRQEGESEEDFRKRIREKGRRQLDEQSKETTEDQIRKDTETRRRINKEQTGVESPLAEKPEEKKPASNVEKLQAERDALKGKLGLAGDKRRKAKGGKIASAEESRLRRQIADKDREISAARQGDSTPEAAKGRGHIGKAIAASGTHDEGRTRQGHIDRARAVADVAGEMDELDFGESSLDEMKARAKSAADRAKGPQADDLKELSDKIQAAKSPAEVARISHAFAESHGLTRTGRAGRVEKFDPKMHESIDGRKANGDKVEIVRPGYSVHDGDKDVTLSKARVEEALPDSGASSAGKGLTSQEAAEKSVKSAAKAAPAKKAPELTSREAAEKSVASVMDRVALRMARDSGEDGFLKSQMPSPEAKKQLDDLTERGLLNKKGGRYHLAGPGQQALKGHEGEEPDASAPEPKGVARTIVKKKSDLTDAQERALESLKSDPNAKIHPSTRKALERKGLLPGKKDEGSVESKVDDKIEEAVDEPLTDAQKKAIRREALGKMMKDQGMLEGDRGKMWDKLSDDQKDKIIDEAVDALRQQDEKPGGRIAVVDKATGKEVSGKTTVVSKATRKPAKLSGAEHKAKLDAMTDRHEARAYVQNVRGQDLTELENELSLPHTGPVAERRERITERTVGARKNSEAIRDRENLSKPDGDKATGEEVGGKTTVAKKVSPSQQTLLENLESDGEDGSYLVRKPTRDALLRAGLIEKVPNTENKRDPSIFKVRLSEQGRQHLGGKATVVSKTAREDEAKVKEAEDAADRALKESPAERAARVEKTLEEDKQRLLQRPGAKEDTVQRALDYLTGTPGGKRAPFIETEGLRDRIAAAGLRDRKDQDAVLAKMERDGKIKLSEDRTRVGFPGDKLIPNSTAAKKESPAAEAPKAAAATEGRLKTGGAEDKGVHEIRLPDGSVEKRTSKTRQYTHAVLVTRQNHKEADRLDKEADKLEALAKRTDRSESQRKTDQRSADNVRAEAKKFREGPEETSFVGRWSTSEGAARGSLNAYDIGKPKDNPNYTSKVVKVGDDLSGGKKEAPAKREPAGPAPMTEAQRRGNEELRRGLAEDAAQNPHRKQIRNMEAQQDQDLHDLRQNNDALDEVNAKIADMEASDEDSGARYERAIDLRDSLTFDIEAISARMDSRKRELDSLRERADKESTSSSARDHVDALKGMTSREAADKYIDEHKLTAAQLKEIVKLQGKKVPPGATKAQLKELAGRGARMEGYKQTVDETMAKGATDRLRTTQRRLGDLDKHRTSQETRDYIKGMSRQEMLDILDANEARIDSGPLRGSDRVGGRSDSKAKLEDRIVQQFGGGRATADAILTTPDRAGVKKPTPAPATPGTPSRAEQKVEKLPESKAAPEKVSGGKIDPAKKSTKPRIKNSWGGLHVEGQASAHPDGVIPRETASLGADGAIDVDGDRLDNVLDLIATDTVLGRTTGDEQVQALRTLAARLPEGRAKRTIESMADDLDAPKRPLPASVEGAPEPLQKLAKYMLQFPLARGGSDSDRSGRHAGYLDALDQVLKDWHEGKLSGMRLPGEIQSKVYNRRHESYEGKVPLDRVIADTVKELEAILKSPGGRDKLTSPKRRQG